MDIQFAIGLGILVVVYALIAFNLINRTVAALLGALLVAIFLFFMGDLEAGEIMDFIDFNTIVLLMSMMVIVGILGRTGFFQVMAYRTAKASGGNPWKILISMTLLTAFLSAFLDNVTTILLIIPVTLELTKALKVNPLPFIFSEIFASNIGGTATLVGDPPNIMIGGASGLGFLDFIVNLAPIVIVDTVILLGVMWLLYRKDMARATHLSEDDIKHMEEDYRITDRVLYHKAAGVLVFTIALFILGDTVLGIPPMASAFTGMVILLLLTRDDIRETLEHVEWPTLLFFAGLFIVVGGVEKMGVIDAMADSVIYLAGGSFMLALVAILWVSATSSAIIDNIPFTATMIPVVFSMAESMSVPSEPLLWALSLGACMGGNATLIGASANVVGAGLAERNGIFIDFKTFMKNGVVVTVITVSVAMVYLLVRYGWMG